MTKPAVVLLPHAYANLLTDFTAMQADAGKEHQLLHAGVGGQDYLEKLEPSIKEAMVHYMQHDGATLLAYLATQARQEGISLRDKLKQYRPPAYSVDLEQAYMVAATLYKRPYDDQFLADMAERKLQLSAYPRMHEEAYGIATAFFRQMGVKNCQPDQVIFCNTGTNGNWLTILEALFTHGKEAQEIAGPKSILMEKNFYHYYSAALQHCHGQVAMVEQLTPESLAAALEHRKAYGIRAIYIQGVRNPDGHIRTEAEVCALARTILTYNHQHPKDPVYVIDDEVYYGAGLNGRKVTPISSVAIDGLGDMYDYSVVMHSPSKTYAAATARVGWMASGVRTDTGPSSQRLQEVAYHGNGYQTSGPGMRLAVASIALTPQAALDKRAAYYRAQLAQVKQRIGAINRQLGADVMGMSEPDGAWFTMLRFDKQKLPPAIRNSFDLSTYFMRYGGAQKDSGLILYPGVLFGYEQKGMDDGKYLYLRFTVSQSPERTMAMLDRIDTALQQFKSLSPDALQSMLGRSKSAVAVIA